MSRTAQRPRLSIQSKTACLWHGSESTHPFGDPELEETAKQPGGIDAVVGRVLRLNDNPYTVVGVAPESFTFLNPEVRLWAPLAFTPQQRSEEARHSQNHDLIARLADGAS